MRAKLPQGHSEISKSKISGVKGLMERESMEWNNLLRSQNHFGIEDDVERIIIKNCGI